MTKPSLRAALERGAFVAAHDLDEDINVIAAGKGDGVILPRIAGQVDAAILVLRPGRDGHNLNRASGARGQKGCVFLDDPDDADTHRAQASNAQPKW